MAEDLVLGLGGTVDYEIRWDAEVLSTLAREYGIRLDELTTTTPIIDERSLVVTVLAFLATGGGGERFVLSSEIVQRFAGHFDVEVTLGADGSVVSGWVFASHQIGAAVVASVAGVTRDHLGDYDLAWYGAGVLCLLAALMSSRIVTRVGNRREAAILVG